MSTNPTNAAKRRFSGLGWEIAQHIIAENDTEGRPEFYALAEDYIRLTRTIDALLPVIGCHTVGEAVAAFGGESDG